MAEIKNEHEFKAWLEGKPREVAQVLAFRSAMRVLPLVGEVLREGEWKGKNNHREALIFPVFGAVGVGWLPPLVLSQAAFAYADSALSALPAYSTAVSAARSAARYAALAAARSAYSAYSAADSARSAALSTALSTAYSASYPAAIWRELSQDVSALEAGTTPEKLNTAPLWHKASKLSRAMDQEWVEMKQNLPATAPEWRFWCEWYERVRDGQPFPDLKKRFAPILAKPEPETEKAHLTRIAELIKAAVAREEVNRSSPPAKPQSSSRSSKPISDSNMKKIFIVHGHDPHPKEAVARFLEKIKLEPIILHEQANQGKTLIEKFEKHADVHYAIILMTPDDLGRAQSETETELKPRARQNVIMELGYFIGKLGRDKVFVLKKGEVEPPSDITGVVWIPFDDQYAWKQKLGQELENAGFAIDWNLVMKA